jgi:phosphoglycerate dehydrogenase-like enzyme
MPPCRLLVCRAPQDDAALTIDRAAIDAAIARAGGIPVDAIFLGSADPAMPDALASATALVGSRLPTGLIRGHGAGLRLVQTINAGIDNLAPFDWLAPGTALCNASGIHAAKLQEWAGMVLLMLHGQMPYFATAQRNHAWSRRHSSLIAGKTVLIFGTGGLGGAVARAARGLGLRAIGVRRQAAPAEDFDEVIAMAAHGAALRRADFVVLTLPLTTETRGLADAAFFAALRPGAGFANFGRGALVDQPALCAALESGAIGGAIIDVATPEPLPPDSPLWTAKNLIITPHVSCDDPATYVADALDLLMENLKRLAYGRPLRNRVDPSLGY